MRQLINDVFTLYLPKASLVDIEELQNVQYLKELNVSKQRQFKSLKGCPSVVDRLRCSRTSIQTLEYGPKKSSQIWCSYNENFISLKGCPQKLKRLVCTQTGLTSLKYGPKQLFHLSLGYNPQLILENVWEIIEQCDQYVQHGIINVNSKILGLLRIKNLKIIRAHMYSPLYIVAKYVPITTMSSILQCKRELIEAGFASNAKF